MPTKKEENITERVIKAEKKIEKTTEKVVDELEIRLPKTEGVLPFEVRLIMLLSLLGGLAIVGGLFADTFTFEKVNVLFYFFRLSMGLLLIFIAYALHKRRLYALWLFAMSVILGCVSNPLLSILPALIFLYLYTQRKKFKLTKTIKIGKFKISF